jgi:hypothetical protein
MNQTPTCTDCGSTPRWWRSDTYCRRCSDKNGHTYLSNVLVDVDKVLAFFKGDVTKTEAFFKETE